MVLSKVMLFGKLVQFGGMCSGEISYVVQNVTLVFEGLHVFSIQVVQIEEVWRVDFDVYGDKGE